MKTPFNKNEQSNESGAESNEANDLLGGLEHPIDASQGSEYLDDAVRMHEQPLKTPGPFLED